MPPRWCFENFGEAAVCVVPLAYTKGYTMTTRWDCEPASRDRLET